MPDDYPERVSFAVDGDPATQGSKKHVGGGRMVEVSKGLKPWRNAVDARARDMAEKVGKFQDGPLELHITFYMPHGQQREKSPWKAKDLDKLIRAVGDALKTGGLIEDDSRFVRVSAEKVWAPDEPGARITISTLEGK